MILNLNKRGKMKVKFLLLVFVFVLGSFSYADEKKEENANSLDVLDKQSQEFWNDVIGLDKEYLENQVNNTKDKKKNTLVNPQVQGQENTQEQGQGIVPTILQKSQKEITKEVFKDQNEIDRLSEEVLRAKKLQDIKIKSMYSFNGRNYVVLKSKEDRRQAANESELSSQIEGRYRRGDNILGYTIKAVDIRTKSLKLYKEVDDKYAYYVYLNNYGVTTSDLKKIEKKEVVEKKVKKEKKKKEVAKEKKVEKKKKEKNKIKKVFSKVKTNSSDKCYKLVVNRANVRKDARLRAKILRVLRKNDKFTIVKKSGRWLQIDTIYKYKSGDVMDVKEENNWVKMINKNFKMTNCL